MFFRSKYRLQVWSSAQGMMSAPGSSRPVLVESQVESPESCVSSGFLNNNR